MLVVDTSALLAVLASDEPVPGLAERISADSDLHVPAVADVELLHALRRLVRRGELSVDRANDVRTDFADLALTRYPHPPLADRAWELRDTVTAYDAMFVALAESLDVPLVTCDGRLARAPGVRARVELFPG